MREANDEIYLYKSQDRLKILIDVKFKGKNDWKGIEEKTGIDAVKWRQFFAGVRGASVEMIEAACNTWPEHCFWLMTGTSDEVGGHKAPNACLDFPNMRGNSDRGETDHDLFQRQIKFLDVVVQGWKTKKWDLKRGYKTNTTIQMGSPETKMAIGIDKEKEIIKELYSYDKARNLALLEWLNEYKNGEELQKEIEKKNKELIKWLEDYENEHQKK
jgi:hypothetical protein